jgi:lactoylglutathione lyase
MPNEAAGTAAGFGFLGFVCLPKKCNMNLMKVRELNHVAVHVENVERSCSFYKDVLRLERLPRPAFDFPGAWFRLGPAQELHLIGRNIGPIPQVNPNTHFALVVDDIVAWEKHLEQSGAVRRPLKKRPDGVWQIFLRDPDGNFIELFMP